MKQNIIPVDKIAGLVPAKEFKKNVPGLQDSDGVYILDDRLTTLPEFVDLVGEVSCPYPQIIDGLDATYYCTASSIGELDPDGVITTKISGLTVGSTWSLADFGSFVLFQNGACTVVRDPIEKRYYTVTNFPQGYGVLNYQGQAVMVGAAI